MGEIKEEAEGRGTFAQRAAPPGKKRPPEDQSLDPLRLGQAARR